MLYSLGYASIAMGILKKAISLDKDNVSSYELITDEHRKSAASGVARGLVGGALLGPVGMLAGGLSAKNKGIFQVVIEFNDGKRSPSYFRELTESKQYPGFKAKAMQDGSTLATALSSINKLLM